MRQLLLYILLLPSLIVEAQTITDVQVLATNPCQLTTNTRVEIAHTTLNVTTTTLSLEKKYNGIFIATPSIPIRTNNTILYSSLNTGTYRLYIDSNFVHRDSVTFYIGTSPQITILPKLSRCGCDGSAKVLVRPGTSTNPIQSVNFIYRNATNSADSSSIPLQYNGDTLDVNQLCDGYYRIEVIDQCGNIRSKDFHIVPVLHDPHLDFNSITSIVPTPLGELPMQSNCNHQDIAVGIQYLNLCGNSNSSYLGAWGGFPRYTYSISGNGIQHTQASPIFRAIPYGGTYIIRATDSCGTFKEHSINLIKPKPHYALHNKLSACSDSLVRLSLYALHTEQNKISSPPFQVHYLSGPTPFNQQVVQNLDSFFVDSLLKGCYGVVIEDACGYKDTVYACSDTITSIGFIAFEQRCSIYSCDGRIQMLGLKFKLDTTYAFHSTTPTLNSHAFQNYRFTFYHIHQGVSTEFQSSLTLIQDDYWYIERFGIAEGDSIKIQLFDSCTATYQEIALAIPLSDTNSRGVDTSRIRPIVTDFCSMYEVLFPRDLSILRHLRIIEPSEHELGMIDHSIGLFNLYESTRIIYAYDTGCGVRIDTFDLEVPNETPFFNVNVSLVKYCPRQNTNDSTAFIEYKIQLTTADGITIHTVRVDNSTDTLLIRLKDDCGNGLVYNLALDSLFIATNNYRHLNLTAELCLGHPVYISFPLNYPELQGLNPNQIRWYYNLDSGVRALETDRTMQVVADRKHYMNNSYYIDSLTQQDWGYYIVSIPATTYCPAFEDSIYIQRDTPSFIPIIQMPDIEVCEGELIQVAYPLSQDGYSWGNGRFNSFIQSTIGQVIQDSNGFSISTSISGLQDQTNTVTYYYNTDSYTSNCGYRTGTFNITVKNKPSVVLQQSSTINLCQNSQVQNTIEFDANFTTVSYFSSLIGVDVTTEIIAPNKLRFTYQTNSQTLSQTGTIRFHAINSNCLGEWAETQITVHNNPVIDSIPELEGVCSNITIPNINLQTSFTTAIRWVSDNGFEGSEMPISNISFQNQTNLPEHHSIYVTATNQFCTSTQTISIYVAPEITPMQFNFEDIYICSGTLQNGFNLDQNLTDSIHYMWSINQSIGLPSSGTGSIPSFIALNTGTDSIVADIIVIKYTNGCYTSDTDTFKIVVYPQVLLSQPQNRTVYVGDIVVIPPFNVDKPINNLIFRWSHQTPSVGLSQLQGEGNIPTFSAQNPSVMNDLVAEFNVEAQSNQTCPVQEKSFTVTVKPRPFIFIPNGFSPNGDGENDMFVIVTNQNLQKNVKIFNQWGSLVYQNENYQNDWNGTNNTNSFLGKHLVNGTYFYIVDFKDPLTNMTTSQNGYLTLQR